MTHYIKSGETFRVATDEALDLHDTLPVGTYTVKFDERAGQFFLSIIDDFTIAGKLYGDTPKNCDRILRTFRERSSSTGVMLSGEKGSGKSLLAKVLSVEAAKLGIPTIVINNAWYGEEFNIFIQMIAQEAVIIFDEFEKVYDTKEQEQMLTLLDGVYPSKKLFVLTCNNRYRVDENMQNRPGRIYYRLDYSGLDRSFIEEYCEDNLKDKSQIEAVCTVSSIFSQFNFDILKAMVEEMNRYGETPQEVMRLLNAKPESDSDSRYVMSLSHNGQPIPAEQFRYGPNWEGNPLTDSIHVLLKREEDEESSTTSDPFGWEPALTARRVSASKIRFKSVEVPPFTVEHLVSIDKLSGGLNFQQGDFSLKLEKTKPAVFSMERLDV